MDYQWVFVKTVPSFTKHPNYDAVCNYLKVKAGRPDPIGVGGRPAFRVFDAIMPSTVPQQKRNKLMKALRYAVAYNMPISTHQEGCEILPPIEAAKLDNLYQLYGSMDTDSIYQEMLGDNWKDVITGHVEAAKAERERKNQA